MILLVLFNIKINHPEILIHDIYLGWPTSGNNEPTNPSDDYYDEDYPPYTYDDDDDDISIDQPGNPIDNVPDFINPQPQPPPQSGRVFFIHFSF